MPQFEDAPFRPRSPYGVAKLCAHWITVNCRQRHGIFGCSGILFDHESTLRGRYFVTRKIPDGVAELQFGTVGYLELGNLDARRDSDFAGEYVKGIWPIMRAEQPDTYVLPTGRTESIREFARMVFAAAGIAIEFRGSGGDEIALDVETGNKVVLGHPRFYRPTELNLLVGDASKACNKLGRKSAMADVELCAKMVSADLRRDAEGRSF